jgi:signal transduction histidine kinase/ActR/RegA family two-component response regulator
MSERHRLERRLLLLAPTERDATMAESILGDAGIDALACRDPAGLVAALAQGAGAVLIAEEMLADERSQPFVDALARQPPWSDLPVIILTAHGADSPTVVDALDTLGNVSLLERPTRVATLVSTARSALRARERQYQLRDYLAERARTEEALREADRRKDEFLATLGHELRNPLAPISNSLHLLRLTLAPDDKTDRICDMMERQLKGMVRLVDDLLEVSRITRGKIALRREEVSLAAVVRGAIDTTRPLLDAARHELVVSLPAEPLLLDGDALRLGQVFANLLNNAIKYTPARGRIAISAWRDGDDVVVTVRDSGIGIPPEMLTRVFDMFMQVPRQAEPQPGGLGIGLTLVRNLVEMHGGRVHARSDGPGRGTEIVVRLPLAEPARPPSDAPSPPPATLPCRRVLVVDDNRDAADSLGLLLELLGAQVEVVHDGPAALRALERYQPAVVVLDIGMPGMDGYEVARRIRQHAQARDVVLVALTGWGQEEDRRRCRSAGFDHHLTKPIDVQAFQALMGAIADEGARPVRH